MTATFSWPPDVGLSVSHQPRLRKAQFGDGYEQRSADGLNPDMPTWSPTFSCKDTSTAADIEAFLVANIATAFFWTPPNGSQGLYVCEKWTRSYTAWNVLSISAEFRQVPA
jgi:phage-related protein